MYTWWNQKQWLKVDDITVEQWPYNYVVIYAGQWQDNLWEGFQKKLIPGWDNIVFEPLIEIVAMYFYVNVWSIPDS